MNSSPLLNPAHQNSMIESDRRTIKYESIALVIFGAALLNFNFLNFSSDAFWVFIILPLPYIITGIVGILELNKDSDFNLNIFKVLIYALIVLNAALGLLAIVLLVYLIAYPTNCSNNETDSCYFEVAFTVFFEIISSITAIICGFIILFLFVVLNHIKKFENDLESRRYT